MGPTMIQMRIMAHRVRVSRMNEIRCMNTYDVDGNQPHDQKQGTRMKKPVPLDVVEVKILYTPRSRQRDFGSLFARSHSQTQRTISVRQLSGF